MLSFLINLFVKRAYVERVSSYSRELDPLGVFPIRNSRAGPYVKITSTGHGQHGRLLFLNNYNTNLYKITRL